MTPPVLAILQYCPYPPQATPPTTDHQPPNYSLWYLEPHIRRSWLMSLLVILYKVKKLIRKNNEHTYYIYKIKQFVRYTQLEIISRIDVDWPISSTSINVESTTHFWLNNDNLGNIRLKTIRSIRLKNSFLLFSIFREKVDKSVSSVCII